MWVSNWLVLLQNIFLEWNKWIWHCFRHVGQIILHCWTSILVVKINNMRWFQRIKLFRCVSISITANFTYRQTDSFVCLCMTVDRHVCQWVTIYDYDYIWLCMTMYANKWLCMTVYDFVWLCMTKYNYVWLCMTMYDYVWLCMTM